MTLVMCMFSSVKANSVTLIKEKFDNVYTNYYDFGQNKERFLYTSKYLFGDKVAYCLELGKDINSFNYTFTTSFDGIDIGKDELEYAKLVSYYGYNYPGHNTDRYYMAAQKLIWQAIIKTSIKFTIGFDVDNFYNLSKEETNINVLVNRHNIKPSFDGLTLDVSRGKEVVLEDRNSVLYLYYSDNNDVVIEGNNLIITSNFNDDHITLKRYNYTDSEFFLYTSGNSQKMMSSGGISNAISELNINLIDGSIEIAKYDSELNSADTQGDASLDGAIYDLYDENNNFIDYFVTGKKNRIDGLAFGDYSICEREAPVGYLKNDTCERVLIDGNNSNVYVTLYDDVIKREVQIFKVYGSDETGILTPEGGATFDIYRSDGTIFDQITTDSDGFASIVLPYGIYTFKQVTGDDSYYLIDDFEVVVDSADERPIYKLLSDSLIKAKVRVIKKDYESLENIVNGKASFRIFDVDKKVDVSFKVSYPEDVIIDTFEIGEDGTFTTPFALPYGNYMLYEVDDDMDGYLYNNENVYFSIDESMTSINEGDDIVLEVSFYNKRVKGKVNILKYGEEIKYDNDSYVYDRVLLNDVLFNLFAKDDIYVNGKMIFEKDEKVGECTTFHGECSIDDLPLGDYYLKEVSSSGGNIVDTTDYMISLLYKDQYTDVVSYDIEVNNYLPKGKIVIDKYELGSDKKISDTLIEIRDMKNSVVYKGYTDVNGQIVIDDLLYGDYYVAEVEASTGYKLTMDKINFRISEEDTYIKLYNERIKVPNTGIDFRYEYIIFIGFGILFGVAILSKNRAIMATVVFLFVTLSVYYGVRYFRCISDKRNNARAVSAVMNGNIGSINNDKYRYKAILEVPSVEIKRGILDIDNKYNKAKYNIELVKEEEDVIVLASHNGNNYNSFFGKLKNISLGDEINYYYNGKIYRYIYSDSYEIKKNGMADIYRKNGKKAIVLITCNDYKEDGQIVFVGYLKEILDY